MRYASFRSTIILAVVALGALAALPGQAQVIAAPPPNGNLTGGYGYNPPQQQPGFGPQQGFGPPGFGQQPGFGPQQGFNPGQGQGQFGPPGGGQPALQLPDGVDKLYALEGDNSLVLFGTQAGYATVRDLVRGLDGDLDIIRTQVSLVKVTRTALPGQTLTGNVLTAGDVSKLLAARLAGQLPASATARVTTREDTEVDTLLGSQRDVPLTFIPRLGADGRVALQFTQPLDTTISVRPGRTYALALPLPADAQPGDPFSVLFITPSILPSNVRR